MVRERRDILEGRPVDQNATEHTLWQEQWNKLLWGPELELDQAEAATKAKSQAGLTGKGAQLGKGKRHWSNVAIYTNDYEPYPFKLDMVIVEAVFFSWDEMCDKFKAEQHKIGDYGVATIQGKPPASVGATLRTEGIQAPAPTALCPFETLYADGAQITTPRVLEGPFEILMASALSIFHLLVDGGSQQVKVSHLLQLGMILYYNPKGTS